MAMVVNGGAAFSITSELIATQDIAVTGIPYYDALGEDSTLTLKVLIQGTVVLTLVEWPTTSSFTFSNININSIKTALYDALVGKSRTGAVVITVISKYEINPYPSQTVSTTAGNITLAARLTAGTSWVTKPTTANPWDLDAAGNPVLTLAWTRPHTGFRARIKFYIWNGSSWILQFNRYYFTTSCNFDVTPYVTRADMIADMGGVSPQDFKVELITQWQNAAADAEDISGVDVTKTYIDAVLHAFYDGSKVGLFDGANWIDHESYIHNGTAWILQQVYVYNGTSWVESL